MHQNALIIFIKTPIPFNVKTRLLPYLSGEEAAQLYQAFLRDINNRFSQQSDFDCWYAISPENFDQSIMASIVDLQNYFIQKGKDIGERMSNSFGTLSTKGYQKITLIGGDIPTIPRHEISKTFDQLDIVDCVIGPTLDGGYYLLAMKMPQPQLFKGIDWSTSFVFEKTVDNIKKNGLSFDIALPLQDVDTHAELKDLYRQLKIMKMDFENFPEHSWRFIQTLRKNGKI